MNKYLLKPISEIVEKIEKQTEESIESLNRHKKKSIKKAERNRSLLADLDAVGIKTNVWTWDTLENMEVFLGSVNTQKTKKGAETERSSFVENFRKVRELIGGPLKITGKHLHNAKQKLIKMKMENDAFPGVEFTYICKLPQDAKCKIVRRKSYSSYASLVCEI